MGYRGGYPWWKDDEAAIRRDSQRRAQDREQEDLKKRVEELETKLNDCIKEKEELIKRLEKYEKI